MLRLISCLSFLLFSQLVPAQAAYPTKPLEFVVSSQPGGAADIVARLIGPKLVEAWGQPYVVTYKPGAGANIGPEFAAKAPKDGHTILISFAGMTISPSLYPNLRYDPVRDFVAVSLVAKAPLVLVVNPKVKASTVSDLIAYAKVNPGKLTWGHAGPGTAQHLNGVLFANAAGIDVLQIPFNGSSSVTTGLLSDVVEVQFDNMASIMPQVKAGKLRGLAVTSPQRSRSAPDVPTVAESGFPGFEMGSWHSILVPAKTPKAIITLLHAELVKTLAQPDVKERFASQGLETVGSTPEEFREHLKRETAKYAKVIKAVGIKPD